MPKMLDLTRNHRIYMPIRLDEVGVINVATPEKHVYDELIGFYPELSNLNASDPEDVQRAISGLYNVAALIMSNNREGRQFTPEELVNFLPVDSAVAFLSGYADFLTEIKFAREKN